jgi:pentatricopeptide repeat protein
MMLARRQDLPGGNQLSIVHIFVKLAGLMHQFAVSRAGIGNEQPHVYTALLGAASAVGDAGLAQQLFASMVERGVPPNQVTDQ